MRKQRLAPRTFWTRMSRSSSSSCGEERRSGTGARRGCDLLCPRFRRAPHHRLQLTLDLLQIREGVARDPPKSRHGARHAARGWGRSAEPGKATLCRRKVRPSPRTTQRYRRPKRHGDECMRSQGFASRRVTPSGRDRANGRAPALRQHARLGSCVTLAGEGWEKRVRASSLVRDYLVMHGRRPGHPPRPGFTDTVRPSQCQTSTVALRLSSFVRRALPPFLLPLVSRDAL